jgi:pyruvate dehydrogenase E2 component (dihydrolipoamide acetyltransferase)
MDFRLPNLGEGIETGVVSRLLVKPGDMVTVEQNVIIIETDKAAMDVASDVAGKVDAVLVKPGDKIAIGTPILKLSGAAAPVAAPAAPPVTAAPAPVATAAPSHIEFKLPSLGEGIETGTVSRVLVKPGDVVALEQNIIIIETDKAAMDVSSDVAGTVEAVMVKPGDKIGTGAVVISLMGVAKAAPVAPVAAVVAPKAEVAKPVAASVAPVNGVVKSGPAYAGPATRRLARELGLALAEVPGSARGGRVTLDDVKGFVRTRMSGPAVTTKAGGTVVDVFMHPALPDFAKFGEIEKKPVSNIRKKIAENLTIAVRMIPSVTQNELADITDLEAGRKRIVETLPKGTAKITWTVLAVKAVVAVLKEFPNFNSSFDMNSGELILKKYFNIGIAVDTERGLVVPVIKNADTKSIRDIANDVAMIADKARNGKLTPDEMRGGSFTITNLGGIGGTSFTPIVNYPEVAILGLSKSTLQPIVKDGQILPRLMMPMSLTYDHRVIDGADGARFTTRLAQLFSDPIRLLMES